MTKSSNPKSDKDKLKRTQKIILDEEAHEIREEVEQRLQFERDVFRQNLTEAELRYEKGISEMKDQLVQQQTRIEQLEKLIADNQQAHLDARKLSIILSELSLKLMASGDQFEK